MDSSAVRPKGDENPSGNTVKTALDAGRKLALTLHESPFKERGRPYFIGKDNNDVEKAIFVDEREALLPYPTSDAGVATMHDMDSFLRYWQEHSQPHSRIYAEMLPTVRFTGIIDEHVAKDRPGWREHQVVYAPTLSNEWKSWSSQDRKDFSNNEDLAYFIEDRLPDISQPPAEDFLAMITTFRVDENRHWNNDVKLSNGKVDFSFRKLVDGSAMDSSGGRMEIPEKFVLKIPVFSGINVPMYEVETRFRWRSRDGRISMRYEMVRTHKVLEKAFVELLDRVKHDTAGQLLFGSPSRK